MDSLQRFVDAQHQSYASALTEIKNGRKTSHWMWFIFPQIAGLAYSETARYYAIKDLNEAQAFYLHPILGKRIIEISNELLKLPSTDAHSIFGSPDDLKLKSSMTLFSLLPDSHPVFQQILDKYFQGQKDIKTIQILQNKTL